MQREILASRPPQRLCEAVRLDRLISLEVEEGHNGPVSGGIALQRGRQRRDEVGETVLFVTEPEEVLHGRERGGFGTHVSRDRNPGALTQALYLAETPVSECEEDAAGRSQGDAEAAQESRRLILPHYAHERSRGLPRLFFV